MQSICLQIIKDSKQQISIKCYPTYHFILNPDLSNNPINLPVVKKDFVIVLQI